MNRRRSIHAVCPIMGTRGTAVGEIWSRRMAIGVWRRTTHRLRLRLRIWVVLFAITMMFAAFTSALIVRKGSSLDWQKLHLAVDPLLQHRFAPRQQRHAGSLASPHRCFHG